MPVRLCCPSCNTRFTVPDLPGDRRAVCPRCGDPFPVRTWEETEDDSLSPVATSTLAGGSRAGLLVPAVILVVIAIGLVVFFSRDRMRGRPVPGSEAAGGIKAATQLVGIGYLPADTNIAFAVQVQPVLAYADRTKQDARALLARAGVPNQFFDSLSKLDLTLEQMDHVAGGTSLGDKAFEVRFTLVLVLRASLPDDDEFLDKLKARRQPGSGKPRYDVELAGLPLTLAQVSETVWVFGFDAKKDLQAVDRDGYGPGGQQFAPSLTAMLTDQVPPTAAAWVATADERWAEKPVAKLAAQSPEAKDWLPVLAKGRAGVLAVSLDDPPRLRLFVRTTDEATGQQLRGYFQNKARDSGQHGGTGEAAFLDLPFDPATTLTTVQQFLKDAGRK